MRVCVCVGVCERVRVCAISKINETIRRVKVYFSINLLILLHVKCSLFHCGIKCFSIIGGIAVKKEENKFNF